MSTERQQKSGHPQIFSSNKALKLWPVQRIASIGNVLDNNKVLDADEFRSMYAQLRSVLDGVDLQAEQWVDKMTKAAEDEPTEVESEGRPSRLGLGAKVSRHSKPGPLHDPVARKLQARLNAGKRNAAKSIEESTPSAKDGHDDEEDEDDDLESRSSAFAKKRGAPPNLKHLLRNALIPNQVSFITEKVVEIKRSLYKEHLQREFFNLLSRLAFTR
ncbi:hypothetical protein JRO89_XSUnG0210000 [Xanthoceras sorbifolium]|uniref:Uncharacterized protein n=1 Tax=Xanthoceras sorbifolium TaxID=99658 RepID=A0ABQ8GX39_9ROSI|nr:hypothetical protein JRO89_XSUnG0210000 [Xanthoceras sorbifolium]